MTTEDANIRNRRYKNCATFQWYEGMAFHGGGESSRIDCDDDIVILPDSPVEMCKARSPFVAVQIN
jgi:hypothetical protein